MPDGVGNNEFVALSATGQLSCHDEGRRLAVLMQAALNEGETAPDVTVRYCEYLLRVT